MTIRVSMNQAKRKIAERMEWYRQFAKDEMQGKHHERGLCYPDVAKSNNDKARGLEMALAILDGKI